MKKRVLFFAAATALAIAGVAGIEIVTSDTPLCAAQPKMSFAEDIMPILQGRCLSCHQAGGAGTESSGFDVSSYEGFMRGGKYGKMIIPGDPESSNLMWLLDWRAAPAMRMPLGKKKLSSCDREAIRWWIREGAKNN